MKATQALALLALSAGLAACGGGASDEPAPAMPSEVPASATVSAASYSQFAGSLVKTETGQPLEVNKVVPPTSETDEPLPVS
jgi:hypothetical protein